MTAPSRRKYDPPPASGRRLALLVVLLEALWLAIGWSFRLLGWWLDSRGRPDAACVGAGASPLDHPTSIAADLLVWGVVIWAFHRVHRSMPGDLMIRSLKVFGAFWLVAASGSLALTPFAPLGIGCTAIRGIETVAAVALVAFVNGRLYPRLAGGRRKRTSDFPMMRD